MPAPKRAPLTATAERAEIAVLDAVLAGKDTTIDSLGGRVAALRLALVTAKQSLERAPYGNAAATRLHLAKVIAGIDGVLKGGA